jgi:hypothetical protein
LCDGQTNLSQDLKASSGTAGVRPPYHGLCPIAEPRRRRSKRGTWHGWGRRKGTAEAERVTFPF